MITEEQIQVCQMMLMERQQELIQKLHQNNPYDLESNAKDSVGELSSYDNHPADMGTELFERSKDLALTQHSEKELEEINAALHAIEEGTYGLCSVCGSPISFERLLSVPTTEFCSEHAKQDLNMNKRPVEEEVISPNITREVEKDLQFVGYDGEDAWQDVSKYGTSETPSDLYGDHKSYDEMYANADEHVGSTEAVENIQNRDE